jgi:hypothetical protein
MRQDILQTLENRRGKVLTFPPQTTVTFQCLDLSLFGILKKKMNDKLPLEQQNSAAGFIRRIFRNLKQTLVPDNIRNAFVHIGIQ